MRAIDTQEESALHVQHEVGMGLLWAVYQGDRLSLHLDTDSGERWQQSTERKAWPEALRLWRREHFANLLSTSPPTVVQGLGSVLCRWDATKQQCGFECQLARVDATDAERELHVTTRRLARLGWYAGTALFAGMLLYGPPLGRIFQPFKTPQHVLLFSLALLGDIFLSGILTGWLQH